MNKIHKVECPYLWMKKDEGKRTTYEKVCSENFDELIEFVNVEMGISWSFCKGNIRFSVTDYMRCKIQQ